MRVLVCANFKKEKSLCVLPEVIDALCLSGITPIMEALAKEKFYDKRVTYCESAHIIRECDIVLTVGGDGTILKWGKKAAVCDKPLIGINTGRLGFMTSLEYNETDKLAALKNGNYTISRRMMMQAEIKTAAGSSKSVALNDVVIYKDINSKLPEFTVKINGITVSRIRADGLIFSTPTGSTAYALSAGGPIIEPTVECIQLTPLCAHTLFNRPMIFGGGDRISVSYASYDGSKVSISVDGNEGIAFAESDELIITKSESFLQLIDIGGSSFYNAVNTKLMRPLK